jgi:hypothetical protein
MVNCTPLTTAFLTAFTGNVLHIVNVSTPAGAPIITAPRASPKIQNQAVGIITLIIQGFVYLPDFVWLAVGICRNQWAVEQRGLPRFRGAAHLPLRGLHLEPSI